MTTFVSRETTRDAIAALFTPYTGTGQILNVVYNNWPLLGTAKGRSPFLVIVSNGSELRMGNRDYNPVRHTMQIISMVQAASPTDTSVTRAVAMDKIDNIQRLVFQVIRDSASAGNAAWDNILISGVSAVDTVLLGELPYMTEVFTVLVDKQG